VSDTIRVPGQATGVAVSPGAVWIANAAGPSVTRIDPTTDRVVARIPVGPNLFCCAPHMSVVVAEDMVWAGLPSGYGAVRIDRRTNRVVGRVKLGFIPCGFAAAGASVWLAGGGCNDRLARVEPGATRPSALLAEPHPVGVAIAFGSVWVASTEAGNVDRIDPITAHVVARLHVGGFPVRIAVGFGSVWVNDDMGRVLRIKPL
jgi:virginiamycin B lyase